MSLRADKGKMIAVWCIGLCVCIVLLGHRLDQLPSEWYGDITIEHTYVSEILRGNFPYQFILSAGPVYHYSIAPIIALIGSTYSGYKYASVWIGILSVLGMFLLGREVGGLRIGIFSSWILATLFPFIVFARLGTSPHFFAVPLVLFCLYAAVKVYRTTSFLWSIAGALASVLGLFTYPATFPLVFCWIIVMGYSAWKNHHTRMRYSVFFSNSIALCGIVAFVVFEKSFFSQSYISEKIVGTEGFMRQFGIGISNSIRTLGMIFVSGDVLFRSNIPHRPILDPFGSIFFCIGFLYCLFLYRWKMVFFVLVWCLLLVPASLPGIPPSEIPSISRTLGILPVIALLMAYGVERSVLFFRWKLLGFGIGTFCIGILGYGSYHAYFTLYPQTLPFHNAPVSATLAKAIRGYPSDADVYLRECCFLGVGLPDTESIMYSLPITARKKIYDFTFYSPSCDSERNVIIISPPNSGILQKEWTFCYTHVASQHIHGVDGEPYAQMDFFIPRTK